MGLNILPGQASPCDIPLIVGVILHPNIVQKNTKKIKFWLLLQVLRSYLMHLYPRLHYKYGFLVLKTLCVPP